MYFLISLNYIMKEVEEKMIKELDRINELAKKQREEGFDECRNS